MIKESTSMFMATMREHNGIRQTFTAVNDLERKAAEMRLLSLRAISKAGIAGMGEAMSAVELLCALYFGQLAGRPVMAEGDYFVLGKGLAAPVLYAVLANAGFFEVEELDFLAKEGAMLGMKQGDKVPGVSFVNFVPGQGMSVALGLAMALKADKKGGRVYVLLDYSDFEQGQVFEAMMMASEERLENLVVVVDDNRPGFDGMIYDKLSAFGFSLVRLMDGHNFEEVLNGFSRSFTTVRRPVCLWCKTVLAKGVDFAEGKPSYARAFFSAGEFGAIEGKFKQILNEGL